MTQRYTDPVALDRMADNMCPECNKPAAFHNGATDCSLREDGVLDRIRQYHADLEGKSRLVALTEAEIGVLKSMVRVRYRKAHRQHATGAARWGEEYDPGRSLSRIALLEVLYRSLGGDPATIEMRGERATCGEPWMNAYTCDRTPGHEGDHKAYDASGDLLVGWF